MDGKRFTDERRLLQEQLCANIDDLKDFTATSHAQSDRVQKNKTINANEYERVIDIHMPFKILQVVANRNAVKGFVPVLEFLSSRPHNVKKYKAFWSINYPPCMDLDFERPMAKRTLIPIKDDQVISGRGWPPVTCHGGPEVSALSVYGEQNRI